ncbi:MAG: hypothetical protein IPK12_21330 [Gemmatimonadetes bacterium]|nr:hypothetical protein [Gemmatimonadota bacterium]
MDPSSYYRSLTAETDALQVRVRQLMDEPHWLTDGEWKESVLRTVLRRHLPPTIGIGRGFIAGPGACSSQIDILLYDASHPLLHRDGDLVFVMPASVRGIIEVKSTIDSNTLHQALESLGNNAAGLNHGDHQPFIGLFGYEFAFKDPGILLAALRAASRHDPKRVVNHVCAGRSSFIRYWDADPYTSDPMRSGGYIRWRTWREATSSSMRSNP